MMYVTSAVSVKAKLPVSILGVRKGARVLRACSRRRGCYAACFQLLGTFRGKFELSHC